MSKSSSGRGNDGILQILKLIDYHADAIAPYGVIGILLYFEFFFFSSLHFISLFYFFLCISSSSHSSVQVENCVQFREYYLRYPHLP